MDVANGIISNGSESDKDFTTDHWMEQLIKKLNIPPDIQKEPYFQEAVNQLASSSFDNLSAAVRQLRNIRDTLKNKTKSLAAENYHIFLATKDASQNILDRTSEMSNANQLLLSQITEFFQCSGEFLSKTRSIEASLKKNRSALENHTQLLEIIELPQLMQTCVHNGHFDDAISIFTHSKMLFNKYGSNSPVLRMIHKQVSAVGSQFVHQLCDQLRAPISLPLCIKTVVFLRRTGLLSEQELRLKFLQTRTACLKNQINASLITCIPKDLSSVDKREKLSGFRSFQGNHDRAYWIATRLIEVTRVQLFDIVTQYRAVFPDEDSILPQAYKTQGKQSFTSKYSGNSVYSTSLLKGLKPFDYNSSSPNLLHAWLVDQVADFLINLSNNLQTMMYQPKANPQELMDRLLKAAGSSSDSNNLMYKSDGNGVCLETLFTQLQSLASQSMYFGRSLQRIGCDFRPHLANLFSNQIELFIQSYIDNIVSEFKSALMNWVWKIPSDSVQVNGSYTERNDSVLSSYSKMINSLLEYPPLILLYNGYVELFRGLNIYCPSALKSRIIIIISNGLHSSALCITQSYDNLKEQHSDDWIDDATCLASAFSTSLTHCILANVIDYLLIEDVDANASLPICSNPTSLYRPILLNLSRMICSPIYLKWSSLLPSLATTTTTTTTTATVQPIVNTNNIDLQVDVHSSTVEDCVNTMTTDLNMLKLSASKPPSVNDSDNYVGSDTVNGVS